MAEPIIAQKAPFKTELEKGDYYWCACGASKNQPFCDGSHKGSEFVPLKFEMKDKGEVYLCGCKKTSNPPFCDGTHAKI